MSDGRGVRKWPNERGDPKWVVAFCFAAVGIFLALGTLGGCSTEGSFQGDDPAALPSRVCRDAHLFPGSFGSALLLCALYLTPTIVVIAASVGAQKTNRKVIFWAGLLVGALLLLAEAMLMANAHVGYLGV
jgi:hypothetical protein